MWISNKERLDKLSRKIQLLEIEVSSLKNREGDPYPYNQCKLAREIHEISYYDLFTLILKKLNVEIGIIKKETTIDEIALVEIEMK